MRQVVEALRRTDAEKRIPVVKLEIDYELATLYDAMVSKDSEGITASKRKLEHLRKELLQLEA
ncbi:hypothetical protein [Bacillus marinisedimentorum]|uniref:hypothetical protein n=1 Tax=Bacillus marinisedimentorum TaxID=1821260 RepID=UPI0007DFA12A|nr:hypothetical protein [Bacillus marinisedimentorum]